MHGGMSGSWVSGVGRMGNFGRVFGVGRRIDL